MTGRSAPHDIGRRTAREASLVPELRWELRPSGAIYVNVCFYIH